jgi:hypothetical protein
VLEAYISLVMTVLEGRIMKASQAGAMASLMELAGDGEDTPKGVN